MDQKNRLKIREFLKVNLGTLQGDALDDFVGKYNIREADAMQMMLLDMGGMYDSFVAVPHPTKPKTHFVMSAEMADKILVLEPEAIP